MRLISIRKTALLNELPNAVRFVARRAEKWLRRHKHETIKGLQQNTTENNEGTNNRLIMEETIKGLKQKYQIDNG